MKKYFITSFLALCCAFSSRGQAPTEAAVISQLFRVLQYNNTEDYVRLFPGVDSLSQWVFQYADRNSEAYQNMLNIQNSLYNSMQFDSSMKEEARLNFEGFLKQSEELGVHWSETVFIRFELDKIRRGRGLISERIAPLRFMGYVYFKDQLTQKTYAFTVFDIMQVNGLWYAGDLVNIFEADSKEKYQEALAADKKRRKLLEQGIVDSTQTEGHVTTDEDEEHQKPSAMKEVAARKFYKGKFDDEVTVQLYVRHIKGGCKEGICSWEALFKFGDQDEFVRMTVSRSDEGKWLFSEDLGGMELMLKGNMYVGTYASNSDKTEYEVQLIEVPISPKKLEMLDKILQSDPEAH